MDAFFMHLINRAFAYMIDSPAVNDGQKSTVNT